MFYGFYRVVKETIKIGISPLLMLMPFIAGVYNKLIGKRTGNVKALEAASNVAALILAAGYDKKKDNVNMDIVARADLILARLEKYENLDEALVYSEMYEEM